MSHLLLPALIGLVVGLVGASVWRRRQRRRREAERVAALAERRAAMKTLQGMTLAEVRANPKLFTLLAVTASMDGVEAIRRLVQQEESNYQEQIEQEAIESIRRTIQPPPEEDA